MKIERKKDELFWCCYIGMAHPSNLLSWRTFQNQDVYWQTHNIIAKHKLNWVDTLVTTSLKPWKKNHFTLVQISKPFKRKNPKLGSFKQRHGKKIPFLLIKLVWQKTVCCSKRKLENETWCNICKKRFFFHSNQKLSVA